VDNLDLKPVIERIKVIQGLQSDKELAPLLGLTSADFSNRKRRGTLIPLLFEWALENDCDLNELFRGLTGEGATKGLKRFVRPVYQMVCDKTPGDWLSEQPVDEIMLSDEFGKDVSVIRMTGTSMAPTICNSGLFAVDRTVTSFTSGQVFVVWIPHEGPVVRRVFIDLERIILRADNTVYPEMVIQTADLPKNKDFILGRVRWVLQTI